MPLTDTKVKNLKPSDKVYRVTDTQGLCVEVKITGVKMWRYRFMIGGKATMMSLGEYPSTSLAEARVKHQAARAEVLAGRSPIDVKREAIKEQEERKINTFDALYVEWFDKRMTEKSEGYKNHIKGCMDVDILPIIGQKVMSDISSADILKIMENTMIRVRKENPNRKKVTGKCVAINNRQWISGVFQLAIQTLRAENDPTYALRRTIERSEIDHARDLSISELKTLFKAISVYQGTQTTINTVKLIMLTFVRTKEIRYAKWKDIDIENATWTIEARVMKKRRTHIVPLAHQSIEIFKEQMKISGNGEFCFPGAKTDSVPIGSTTINRALEYMRIPNTTGHDFRATASTMLNGKGYNADWIEKQLAHVVSNQTRRVYDHSDYLVDRRKMMQYWADYLDSIK